MKRPVRRKPRSLESWAAAILFMVVGLDGVSGAAATPDLLTAVKQGDAHAVQSLVRHRVNVNEAGVDGTTALHWAVRADSGPIAALLIEAGANVNAVNRYGVSPLSLAAGNGNAELLRRLLDAGADPQAANAALPDGQTVLMLAARTGSAESIDLLSARGSDVNAAERRVGATALIWAVTENRAEAARALLQNRADVDVRSAVTRYPHTPPAVVGDPLEEGVSYVGQTVLPKGGWTPLMYAARQGAREVADVLIEFGADLNLTDPDGTSALMLAIINGHYDLAGDLLESGADSNLPDKTGMTPLYAAVDMHTLPSTFGRPDLTRDMIAGSIAAIRNLLAHGANPNARLKTRILKRVYNPGDPRLGEGATPFMRAARGADVPVMRLLLDAGAVPDLTQSNGNSPLLLAVAADVRNRDAAKGGVEERTQAVSLCLDAGADVNLVNGAGDTAAHLAATTRSGASELIRLLVKRGARLDIRNKQGRTALDVALRGRDVSADTIAVLRELGGVETGPAGEKDKEVGER